MALAFILGGVLDKPELNLLLEIEQWAAEQARDHLLPVQNLEQVARFYQLFVLAHLARIFEEEKRA